MKASYHKLCWGLGYAEQSAKSLTFEVYDRLTGSLYSEISTGLSRLASVSHLVAAERFREAQPVLLLLRDAAATTIAWASAARAHNACIVRGQDVQDRRGSCLLPALLQHAEFPYAAGYRWQLAPNGTKAKQARRAGCLPMEVLPASARHRDCLRLLHKLLQVRTYPGFVTCLPAPYSSAHC